jgi:hypothetical protein
MQDYDGRQLAYAYDNGSDTIARHNGNKIAKIMQNQGESSQVKTKI